MYKIINRIPLQIIDHWKVGCSVKKNDVYLTSILKAWRFILSLSIIMF